MKISLSKKEKIFLFAKLVVAGAILIYLTRKFESFSFKELFTAHNLPMMLSVFLLTCFNIMVQLNKWHLVFNELVGKISFKKIAHSFFVGVATGSFTPGRFGEYFGRSFIIKEYSGSEVITASIVDKLSNMVILIFSGLGTALWYVKYTESISMASYILGLALWGILLLLFIFFAMQRSSAAYIYKRIEKVKLLNKIFFHLQILKKVRTRTVFLQLFFSFLLYGIIAFQYGMLTAGFSEKPIEVSFLFVGILTLFVKSFIPSISFGDLGIRESASIFFITGIGLPPEVGFLSAISIFLFNILIPSAIGLVILVISKR